MSPELEHEIIRQLGILQNKQDILQEQQTGIMTDLAVVKDKAHSPETCPLAKQVASLKLSEARRGGIFAVVGIIAIGATSFLFNLLLKAIGK